MKYIIESNNIITIISFVVNMFFLFPFLYKAYKYLTQSRYIKKLLAYDDEPVQIYQSTQEFYTVEGFKYNFINCDSLEGVHNILNIFEIKNQKFVFVNQEDNASNEMCIGGFLNNKRVNSYFTKYFKNFKYYVEEKYKEYYENSSLDTQMIVYSDNKTGFMIDNNLFLETILNKKDYAFLIKLTPDDFKCKKTVHILFGGRAIGTIKAAEYLKTNYKEIYKKYGTKHYFFAIEINHVDNSINHRIGIIDLTEKMFS